MSEIALVSARRFRLESAAKKGSKNARQALKLAGNPNTFLSTVQIGITLIGILTGVFSGKNITDDLQRFLDRVSFLQPYSHSLAMVLVVILITYFSIVFGELIPKRIGLSFPEAIASLVARPMSVISVITKPFIWLLAKTNDLVLGIFKIKDKTEGTVSEEEIKAIIAESTHRGEIQQIENELVKRVFALGDRKAGELMTHRSDVIWFNIGDDLKSVREKIQKNPHTVYPVTGNHPDKLAGLVSVKDIFTHSMEPDKFDLPSIIHKPVFVHENTAAYKVLEQFKANSLHLVVVVDEYGSVQGVLSIADVIDSLIGEGGQDPGDEYSITQRDENSWLVDGQFPYYEFVNYFEIEDAEEADGFTTVAGLILHHLSHFPAEGERLTWANFEFEIIDMDGMRIDKILVNKIKQAII